MAANLRDEHGKTIQLTDEHGNPVVLIVEHGNPMHLTGLAFMASESEKVTDYTSPAATTTADYNHNHWLRWTVSNTEQTENEGTALFPVELRWQRRRRLQTLTRLLLWDEIEGWGKPCFTKSGTVLFQLQTQKEKNSKITLSPKTTYYDSNPVPRTRAKAAPATQAMFSLTQTSPT